MSINNDENADIAAAIESTIAKLNEVKAEIGRVIFGQERVVQETLITILAGGHVLLVGVPGLAKTRLAQTLGEVAGLAPEEGSVHARPDAGRHPGLGGAGRRRHRAARASASSRDRSSPSC